MPIVCTFVATYLNLSGSESCIPDLTFHYFMIPFQESGLRPEIVEAIEKIGFKNATPIQAECIPFILNSKDDLIANAQTGTGKTAAFGLPILEQLDPEMKKVQALILSPTRELALQIAKDMENYSASLPNVNVVAVYGGASAEPQINALRRGAQVVVGTPGRVLDLIGRKKLIVDNIKWLVLDEADEMLNMGFKEELDGILETTPSTRQTLLFSATLPKEILRISKNYMNDPKEIAVAKRSVGADTIEHFAYQVSARDKYAALKRLADSNPNIYAIVFCRTRHETKDIAEKLIKDGYNADSLHGDLSQAQREYVMKRFRVRNLQILVATDVAARGLDVDELTHVINYSLPDDPEVYVHRSGRTGRAGKKGVSMSIVHHRENRKLKEIQKLIGKNIDRKLVPNGREICEKQLFNLVSKMEHVDVENSEIDSFMDVIYAKLDWMSKEEVIKRFVSVEFNRFLAYYKDAKDLNTEANDNTRERRDRNRDRDRDGGSRRERKSKRDGESNSNYQRIYLNLGSKSHVNPASIIGLVNDATPGKSVDIGQIEILKKFSFFEVDKSFAKDVLDGINGRNYRGEMVVAEPSETPKSPNDKPKAKPRREGKSSGKSSGKRKESSKERRTKKQW